MQTTYFGVIQFELWEFLALVPILFLVGVCAFFIKKRHEQKSPEYKYFLPALSAKIFSGLAFAFIYMYYYNGGDTMMYYQSALAFVNLFYEQPLESLKILVSEPKPEYTYAFNLDTGYPLSYMYSDIQTFTVIRLITPLLIVFFKSYLLTTVVLSFVSFFGIWQAYKLVCKYYPDIKFQLAVAFLFVPSAVFWGSGILKDTFTFSATCLYFVSFHYLFIHPKKIAWNIFLLLIAFYLLLYIKPYILLVLLPGSIIWVLNSYSKKIRNNFVRMLFLPVVYSITIIGVLAFFSLIGNSLGEYSLDNVLDKAAITQADLKKSVYGENSFDIGSFEPTLWGVLKKAPIAIISGLFRPFIWEARGPLILFSSLEAMIMILLFLWVFIRAKPIYFFKHIFDSPLLFFCISFSILYAFAVGLTTANFGALVRFKITCLPFYFTLCFVMLHKVRQLKRVS